MNKKIQKLLTATSLIATLATGTVYGQSFDKEQYQKALWMTTRFYGAQRSGVGPNWLVAEHEPTSLSTGIGYEASNFVKGQAFIKDADGDYDLTGGWFDCGDHVKFGQTEFYSAYMLILGYTEFPAGYDDYYSTDYNGYIKADNYTWEGKAGVSDGIPDILNEVKYATDYFIKCVRSSSQFYYQVGDGDLDHKVWCTSTVKSALSKSNGGESDGSRAVSSATGSTTSMTALCGATLAAMARAYKPFDPTYAAQCLEKAKVAYEYVNNTTKGNTGGGSYYPAKSKYDADLTIIAMELYRTTGDATYLQAAKANYTWLQTESSYNHNFSLCYNNTEDLAAYLVAMYGDDEMKPYGKTALSYYVNSLYKPSSGYILNNKNDSWGILRYPANQSFVLGLYNKMQGTLTEVDPYTLASIEYIMGKNSASFSYIVGFGDKYPNYPHHRNFYGLDNNDEGSLTTQAKYMQLGYMVGGSLNDGAYTDDEKSYTYSEGGIDYNAGLVSALGYINSILNTVNVNKFGHPTPKLGEDQSICGQTSITLNSGVSADGNKTFIWSKDGTEVTRSTSASSYEATTAGTYKCQIDSAGEWQTEDEITLLAEMTAPTLTDDVLCDPAQIELNGSVGVKNAQYEWAKDGVQQTDATDSTYTVTTAGVYKVTVSASGCESVSAQATITSKLPVVTSDTSTKSGKVTLTAQGDGTYEWYDAEEGGNLLGTGNTYTTTITANTQFYVQDASSSEFTAGATASTFDGQSALNWGNIAANITVKKSLSINGLDVYLQSVYNSGSLPLTIELTQNGTKVGTYTSDAATVSTTGWVTFNFSTPIEISTAGDYEMTCSGNFAVGYFQNGKSYDTYAGDTATLKFTGCKNTASGSYPNPGIGNLQIQTGNGCARAIANAYYDPNGKDDSGIATLSSESFTLYPNPAEDRIYIGCKESGNCQISLINALGITVMQKSVNTQTLSEGLNISALNKGLYLVKIETEKGIAVNPFIKK